MKYLVMICLLITIGSTSCSFNKKFSNEGYFIHGSKKHAHKYLGEFANAFTSTNGIFGLRYEGRKGHHKGGYQMIDLLLSSDDPKGKVFLNGQVFSRTMGSAIDSTDKFFAFCSDDCQYYNAACFCENDKVKNYFGQDVNILYSYDGEKRFEKTLYVPHLINIKLPNDDLSSVYNTVVERSKFDITWNKDERNQYGVLLTILINLPDIDPLARPKPRQRYIKRSIKVPDTGHFKVDTGIFEDLPSQTEVQVTVERGRFPIIQDVAENDYKISFTSESFHRVRIL